MTISSPSFADMARIPDEYTCNGENTNPPLSFEHVPEEAQSLILVVEDPDAPMGTWDHWMVINIDSLTTGVAPNSIPAGGTQLLNSFGTFDYGGPCPPENSEHRYFFRLYAIDTRLDDTVINDKPGVMQAITDHTIASCHLVGLFSR